VRTLVLALLLLLAAPARAWTTVEAPPLATLEWVAQDMVYNGVPTCIQMFRSKAAPQEVLAYYRQRWTDGGKQSYVENQLGPWKTISRAVGDIFVTVQVRPAGRGSEGYLSQRPVKTPPRPILGQGFPLPPGSEVVNDILSRDGDRQGRTLLAFNQMSVDANAAYFRGTLGKDGWTVASEGRARNGGRQMVLQKGNQELSLALTSTGGRTAVGATIVRH